MPRQGTKAATCKSFRLVVSVSPGITSVLGLMTANQPCLNSCQVFGPSELQQQREEAAKQSKDAKESAASAPLSSKRRKSWKQRGKLPPSGGMWMVTQSTSSTSALRRIAKTGKPGAEMEEFPKRKARLMAKAQPLHLFLVDADGSWFGWRAENLAMSDSSKKTTAAERQAKLREAKGEVNDRATAHGLEELRDIKKAVTATAAAFAPADVSAPGALEEQIEKAEPMKAEQIEKAEPMKAVPLPSQCRNANRVRLHLKLSPRVLDVRLDWFVASQLQLAWQCLVHLNRNDLVDYLVNKAPEWMRAPDMCYVSILAQPSVWRGYDGLSEANFLFA
eukprot:s5129_g4.t3